MSSYTQAEGSTMIAASSRIHSEPTTTNASHPTVKFETKRPRKTKYYDIVRPKVKTPLYQHVGILRYRTEGPNGGNGIVIPRLGNDYWLIDSLSIKDRITKNRSY
jgi:hypothetical protein